MTFSIVARCAATGQVGIGVATAVPSVGILTRYVEPGVGAVATQSLVLMAHGSGVLEGLRDGRSAQTALAESLAADDSAEVRQVAVVSASGEVSTHTGAGCIPIAGHVVGDGFSAQANLMRNAGVPEAMAAAFEADPERRLAERILTALEAAEDQGGDLRGRQSAALVVANPEPTGDPLVDVEVDLRVDDHRAPLVELRRLERLARADRLAESIGDLVAAGQILVAQQHCADALALAPENARPPFWLAEALAAAGFEEEARTAWRQVLELDDSGRWSELLTRLVAVGVVRPEVGQLLTKR